MDINKNANLSMLCDYYELTMGNGYFVQGMQDRITKYYDEKGYKNAEVEFVQREDITADNRMMIDINIRKNSKIRVHKIYITGVDKKEIKPLKQAMKKTNDRSSIKKWFSSKKFLEDKYEEDKGLLIEKMNSWGYRDALVTADSVVKYDDKHVDVYLHLQRGQKYYLRNVNWVGNTVYSTDALNHAFRMKKGDVYDMRLRDKRLSEDEDAIGQQYYNNGYVFYNLDPVEINVEGDSIDLEMRISEGQQATFNRIRIPIRHASNPIHSNFPPSDTSLVPFRASFSSARDNVS